MRHLLFSICFLCFSAFCSGQEAWSLERCVKYAQETNITIQQAQLALRNAQLDTKQSKAARNPSLNARSNGGIQFGRTIDPTTNAFIQAQTGFNSLGLDAGLNLFQGGAIAHSIKQSGHLTQAAQADLERAANDVGLLVAQSYLNILLSEEQLKNAQNQVRQSNEQLKTTRKFIEVGTLPAVDSLNIIAQLTRDEQVLIAAQNNLDLAYLTLRQLLQIEPEKSFKIEEPIIVIPEDTYLASIVTRDIYSTALGNQPAIKAGEWRLRAAHEGVSIAKAALYPTLGLFGQLTSNYSTQYKLPVLVGTGRFGSPTPVQITDLTGNTFTAGVAFYEPDFERQLVSYPKQISDNFGQAVGLNLSIPIYQNGRTALNIQKAKLNIRSVELQNEQEKQQLRSDIQTAIANSKAANNQYKAAQATYNASRLAYENMQKRHTLGAVNSLELTTSRNNLTLAENDVTVARYDYIFKLKILDFYLGRKIKLN